MGVLDCVRAAVVGGDVAAAEEGVRQALGEGLTAGKILHEALTPAMAEVGRRFEDEELFLPEMIIAAKAMKAALAIMRPHLTETAARTLGRVILGTVKGDLHDIGKNLVGTMLEGTGFGVVDLGVDVPPERFIAAITEYQSALVGLSSLLTTTMPMLEVTIEALADAGLRDKVRVMVGGAPVTQAYADQIGADIYAPDAASAARRAKATIG